MEDTNRALLQLCYAGALVDAANNYALLGGTQKIEEKKALEQRAVASQQLSRFGAKTPAEVLRRMMEVFGCTSWEIEEEEKSTSAVTTSCLMCAIAKKTGGASPCTLFCINPMKAYGKALEPSYDLAVEETLWEGKECRFVFERG